MSFYSPKHFPNHSKNAKKTKKKPPKPTIFVQKTSISGAFGAADRSRTDTVSLPRDFESRASANFTTAAYAQNIYDYTIYVLKMQAFFILIYKKIILFFIRNLIEIAVIICIFIKLLYPVYFNNTVAYGIH